MAIIKPSLRFEGSELNLNNSASPYIKEGIRKATFNKSTNQEGAYLYFLSAYKADANGNGVWFKKIYVRDNFGTNFKEKYYVPNRAQDPADYFANNFRLLYPEESRVTDVENNGKKFKKYPNCGRITERVVYNVAFAQNLGAGAHILDLPLRNGAETLMSWLEGKDLAGNSRQPINDPDRCVPVFIRLKENTTNPWMIQVEQNSPVQLPIELSDSDKIYNLDEIFVTKSKEDIIAKLRDMYPDRTFDDCMQGFPGLVKNTVQGSSFSAPQTYKPAAPEAPRPVAAPAMEIPRASIPAAPAPSVAIPSAAIPVAAIPAVTVPSVGIPSANITAPSAPINPPVATDLDSLPQNPMMGRLSREDIARFMSE